MLLFVITEADESKLVKLETSCAVILPLICVCSLLYCGEDDKLDKSEGSD